MKTGQSVVAATMPEADAPVNRTYVYDIAAVAAISGVALRLRYGRH
jgi:hypothetical protein